MTIVTFAAGLIVYAPWLIVLLAIALVPAFVGEAHFNAQTIARTVVDLLKRAAASRSQQPR